MARTSVFALVRKDKLTDVLEKGYHPLPLVAETIGAKPYARLLIVIVSVLLTARIFQRRGIDIDGESLKHAGRSSWQHLEYGRLSLSR